MSTSVCLSVCLRGYFQNHTRHLYQIFLCMLPVSVARSGFGMFTIGRIACRQEGDFFPIENRLGKGDGSAQRERSMLSTTALLTVVARLHV